VRKRAGAGGGGAKTLLSTVLFGGVLDLSFLVDFPRRRVNVKHEFCVLFFYDGFIELLALI